MINPNGHVLWFYTIDRCIIYILLVSPVLCNITLFNDAVTKLLVKEEYWLSVRTFDARR